MTTDLSLDRDELQIVRLGLSMLFEFSKSKGDTTAAQQVLLIMERAEAAIKRLPDKEL